MPFGGLLTVGLISAGTSIAGGIMGSNASGKAADAQVQASKEAMDLINQYGSKGADYLKWILGQQEGAQSPYLQAGTNALGQLAGVVGNTPGYGQFDPKSVDIQSDPSFQWRLQQGQQALERSASARGGALGGGALRSLTQYSQGLASTEYANAFNRALQAYDTNRTTYQQNYGNKVSGLSALAGMGQTAANAMTGAYGQSGGNMAQLYSNTGGNLAALATGAGNARASGYVGGANAWNQTLGNLGSTAEDLWALSKKKW